jgi:hypothetical protein
MSENTRTPHDENATSWRDLMDQLTPEQIAKLEKSESRYRRMAVSEPAWCTWIPRTAADVASTVLSVARSYVADNLNDVLFAEIALPAGAVTALPWDSDGSRCFDGPSWCIERNGIDPDIEVQIVGVQYADGRVERRIAVGEVHHDQPLTPFEGQQLCAVIAAAADEINRLSSDS